MNLTFDAASGLRTAATVAATTVAAVVFAGCSGETNSPTGTTTTAAPSPSSTATATPSPTPSPTPATPTLPAAAQGSGKQAAEAFARYWVATLNASGERLDGSALRRISAETCGACLGIADSMDSIREQEGFSEGGTWKVLRAGAIRSEGFVEVSMRIESEPQRYQNTTGSQVIRARSNEFGVVLRAQRRGDTWIAQNLIFVDE
ncbi:hypothetical protein KLP28_15385 [Nocardioidaceae bacterium]|nr:hypothetical protein KLP28_15385 [Nocardioidaceae bacterium]